MGHSFVAGLRQFLLNEGHQYVPIEKYTASRLKVSNLVHSVSLVGKRGATIRDIHALLPQPIEDDILLLDIGTNDIVQGVPIQHLCQSTIQLVKMILTLGPSVVCVLSVVPRAAGLSSLSEQDFLERALALEQALKPQLALIKNAIYHKHKGFYEVESQGKKTYMSPYAWSRDGIHPNRPGNTNGKKKYMNSLRNAIVACVKQLKHSG